MGRSHSAGAASGLCGVPRNLNSSPKDWGSKTGILCFPTSFRFPAMSPADYILIVVGFASITFACFNRRMAFSTTTAEVQQPSGLLKEGGLLTRDPEFYFHDNTLIFRVCLLHLPSSW